MGCEEMRIHFFTAHLFTVTKQAASKEAAKKRIIKKGNTSLDYLFFERKKSKYLQKPP